jgi:hypothetical protein
MPFARAPFACRLPLAKEVLKAALAIPDGAIHTPAHCTFDARGSHLHLATL